MAEDKLHRQKFNVDQWPTSKVTLYPTRASVVRQIEGVKLKVRKPIYYRSWVAQRPCSLV
jgi:hypothetical protein